MQIPLQITVRDMEHSEALEARIRSKAQKLEEFFAHIVSCHVVVEVPHRHHQQGKQFNVRIDIGVPGNTIVLNRHQSEDVYVALRDAFDAAKRQLQEYSRVMRGDVKTYAARRPGVESEGVGPE